MIRDAEEISARAVEAMVFHRAKSGAPDPIPQKPSELLRDAKPSTSSGASNNKSARASEEQDVNPTDGYKALLAKGMTHEEIVQFLAIKVFDEMERKHEEKADLHNALRSFIK